MRKGISPMHQMKGFLIVNANISVKIKVISKLISSIFNSMTMFKTVYQEILNYNNNIGSR